MKILADENIETAMVEWLRERGHDILWALETHPSISDDDLLQIATHSDRVLLTRDKDFGELVFREQRIATGIILVRLSARNQWERLELFKNYWNPIEENSIGNFLVVSGSRIRIRPLHSPLED